MALGGQAQADTIGAECGGQLTQCLEQEACPVLDRPAIGIRPLVRPVLQELIDQVTVGTVQLHAIKTGFECQLRGVPEVGQDAGDLVDLERAERSGINEACCRLRHAFEADDRRCDRHGATGYVSVALAAAMQDLKEDAASLGMNRPCHGFPAKDMFRQINAGCAVVRAAGDRDRGGLGDQKPSAEARCP